MVNDLFSPAIDKEIDKTKPLAERMRPQHLSEVIGQSHLTGPEGVLSRMIASGSMGSMIFWGPPGTDRKSVV